MEQRDLCVIRGTEELMKGALDNCTIAGGHIILDDIAGRHMLYGCYTSAPLPFPEFDAIMVSWNADTPCGTVVETQVRFMVDGNWTAWSSFGKWSPFIRRGSSEPVQRGPLCVGRDEVRLDSKTARQAQLRIYLYTNSELQTPSVWQLTASVHCVLPPVPSAPRPVHRQLFAPAYSQHLRAPAFQSSSLPVGVCSLLNRWGQDALPEELALAMYDWTDHSCDNLLFAAAAAGCWGFPAWAAYMDLEALRDEVRRGFSVGARLRYVCDPERATPEQPYIPGTTEDSEGALVIVRGFLQGGDGEQVLVNDPLSEDDAGCARQYPLAEFLQGWDGVGLVVHAKVSDAGWDHPARTSVTPRPDPENEGLYTLYSGEQPHPLPERAEGRDPEWALAYTEFDGVAHATTAHRSFHFVEPEHRGVRLPPAETEAARRRVTVYFINESGSMLVGDIIL